MCDDLSPAERESGSVFAPKFDDAGLIAAIVVDRDNGQPLMFAYMNAQALDLTLETSQAHFFSRSRQEIWHKGGTSGNVLTVHEMRTDCDQDVLWLSATAQGHGAACHTGRKSCFYRRLVKSDGTTQLELVEGNDPLFDPHEVYGNS